MGSEQINPATRDGTRRRSKRKAGGGGAETDDGPNVGSIGRGWELGKEGWRGARGRGSRLRCKAAGPGTDDDGDISSAPARRRTCDQAGIQWRWVKPVGEATKGDAHAKGERYSKPLLVRS